MDQKIPWYRTAGLNDAFLVIGLLLFSPLLLWVSFIVATGDIYEKNFDQDGRRKVWSTGKKIGVYVATVVALAISGVYVYFLGGQF